MTQLSLIDFANRSKNVTTLALEQITINKEIHSRVNYNLAIVDEYAEEYRQGEQFPPVIVFDDDEIYWLADGFYRIKAASLAGLTHHPVLIKKGSKRDAILYSVGVNGKHGLRRTNADKRKAVFILLGDSEWKQWSDRAIARQCGVSHQLVNNLRKSICQPLTDTKLNNSRKVIRGEQIYTQKTRNIGKQKKPMMIKEGLNYQAGNFNGRCKWYVELEEETYQKLKEFQKQVNTITLDATLKQVLASHSETVNSDDICTALTSNIHQLTEDRLELVVREITKYNPEIIARIARETIKP